MLKSYFPERAGDTRVSTASADVTSGHRSWFQHTSSLWGIVRISPFRILCVSYRPNFWAAMWSFQCVPRRRRILSVVLLPGPFSVSCPLGQPTGSVFPCVASFHVTSPLCSSSVPLSSDYQPCLERPGASEPLAPSFSFVLSPRRDVLGRHLLLRMQQPRWRPSFWMESHHCLCRCCILEMRPHMFWLFWSWCPKRSGQQLLCVWHCAGALQDDGAQGTVRGQDC
jgi:hypothetical protein